MPESAPLIIDDLAHAYAGNPVLAGLSLSLAAGELLAVRTPGDARHRLRVADRDRQQPRVRPIRHRVCRSNPTEHAAAGAAFEVDEHQKLYKKAARMIMSSQMKAFDLLRAIAFMHGRSTVAFDDVDVVWVPGAWELPIAARHALGSGRYELLVAVGAVIRGDTPHFEYVAGEASRGLMEASREFDLPVGFGLLTCDDMPQAEARAGGAHGNKGWDAALAALEMADLFARLDAASEDDE